MASHATAGTSACSPPPQCVTRLRSGICLETGRGTGVRLPGGLLSSYPRPQRPAGREAAARVPQEARNRRRCPGRWLRRWYRHHCIRPPADHRYPACHRHQPRDGAGPRTSAAPWHDIPIWGLSRPQRQIRMGLFMQLIAYLAIGRCGSTSTSSGPAALRGGMPPRRRSGQRGRRSAISGSPKLMSRASTSMRAGRSPAAPGCRSRSSTSQGSEARGRRGVRPGLPLIKSPLCSAPGSGRAWAHLSPWAGVGGSGPGDDRDRAFLLRA